MSTDESSQSYTEKRYIRFRAFGSVKQSEFHGDKVQDAKDQSNVGKYIAKII